MLVQAYLNFDGRCEEALNFYKKALGAEVTMLMRMNESPEPPKPGLVAPGSAATCLRVRQGKSAFTDGPYAETKEQVAGFYLVEARDLNEAIQVAARIPAASLGTIELRPCRDLIVDGVKHKASPKSR